jgi:1,4-alpha-glucan branching enzyme
MLEIHPGTATEAGSLAGLARRFRDLAAKQRAGEELTPADRNLLGYDAVQLMPVEPIAKNEDHPGYFRPGHLSGGRVEVALEKPDMVNWGYDIVVSGFSAVNPAVLETGRPDELVDFIATCHDTSRPVRVVFDVALGHADNGGLDLLPERFFSGPGMYGQELDYTEPVVRAILLEMQRRKMDFGADGIRVDGAQDFTNWSEERGEWHDDEFLAEMDRVTQHVAGTEYRPWMIYEDGRPWPHEDWELASTYRTLIEQHPHSFQWSPVTFAHNTPALLTFWATKW